MKLANYTYYFIIYLRHQTENELYLMGRKQHLS